MSTKNVTVTVNGATAGTAGFIKWIDPGTNYVVTTDTQTDYITVTDAATSSAGALAANTLWDAAGDLVIGSGADTAVKLAKGTNGQFLQSGATTISWVSPAISVGGVYVGAPPTAANRMVWRAPYACTVTNVRGHAKGGTSVVINARINQTSNFLSSSLTVNTMDAWADGGTVQNTAVAAGDDIEVMLVTVTGAITEASIQVDLTRP